LENESGESNFFIREKRREGGEERERERERERAMLLRANADFEIFRS